MTDSPRQRALAYLEAHHVMTLATMGPDGPWGAAVFYANEGFRLYFLSATSTRHATNLAADPRAAATVQEEQREWRAIRGIQLEGSVARLEGPARDAAIATYARRFPIVAAGAEDAIARALRRVDWYALEPSRLYLIDNSRGLGHRDEIPLTDR